MADRVWRLPTEKSLDRVGVYDGLRLHELVLRFPDGARSGGEVQVARIRASAAIPLPVITVPLEPGEPDVLRVALEAFLAPILTRAGLMGADATLQDVVAPPPPPPGKPLGVL